MIYVHTKIKMLDGSIMCAPIERMNIPCISYGCIIEWKLDESYMVEIYPYVWTEKQDYLKATVKNVREENDCCNTVFVEADEIE